MSVSQSAGGWRRPSIDRRESQTHSDETKLIVSNFRLDSASRQWRRAKVELVSGPTTTTVVAMRATTTTATMTTTATS